MLHDVLLDDSSQTPLFPLMARLLLQASREASIVVVGLQEIEMGGSSVTASVFKDTLAKSMLEKGNVNAQWWYSNLWTVLCKQGQWARVGLRQLSGMLVLVFARDSLKVRGG